MNELDSGSQAEGCVKLAWVKPRVEVHSIADITASNANTATDGNKSNPGNSGQGSDIRLKRNITEVGSMSNGLKLYSFRYNWSEETFVGVMAQDVLEVKPEAVITSEDGFYAVDYDALGLKMISLDKWRETKSVH